MEPVEPNSKISFVIEPPNDYLGCYSKTFNVLREEERLAFVQET
jgi:hypothetical protein